MEDLHLEEGVTQKSATSEGEEDAATLKKSSKSVGHANVKAASGVIKRAIFMDNVGILLTREL